MGRENGNVTISAPLVTGEKRIVNLNSQLQRLFGGGERDLPDKKNLPHLMNRVCKDNILN